MKKLLFIACALAVTSLASIDQVRAEAGPVEVVVNKPPTFSPQDVTALSYRFQAVADDPTERVVKQSTDTSTNADTVTVSFNTIASNVFAFQVSVYKVSGTVGGYVLLQGTVNGTDWIDVNTDTLTNSNQATNTKVWLISRTSYRSYRAVYRVSSGTQKSVLSLAYLRRPDE